MSFHDKYVGCIGLDTRILAFVTNRTTKSIEPQGQ